MSQIAFPFRIDGRGGTARAGHDAHVRQLIEQVIFTSPGERVNRPEMGSGVPFLVFAPTSPEVVSATRLLVQGELQKALDDLIRVDAVEVHAEDARLTVEVRYVIRRTGEARTDQFFHGGRP
jgi:hypothetical protein